MYGVGPFARELLISEAFTSDMLHDHLKAVAVSNGKLSASAIVVAEHLFINVAEQMERLRCNVRALRAALEQAPKILQAICVDLPINVAFGVVNRLVRKVLVVQSLIGHECVGVDRALGSDVGANLRLQVMLATGGNYVRMDFAASFQNADYRRLVLDPAFRDDALASGRVHESGRAADEGFVYFYFAAWTTKPNEILFLESEADAVHHVPRGLLGDAKSAGNLIGTDAILAIHQHPNRNHPLVHAERRILEDGSHFDGELLLASLAEPNLARRDKGVLCRLAARASDFAYRPTQRHRIVESLLRVREKGNGFLQRLGKLEYLVHA